MGNQRTKDHQKCVSKWTWATRMVRWKGRLWLNRACIGRTSSVAWPGFWFYTGRRICCRSTFCRWRCTSRRVDGKSSRVIAIITCGKHISKLEHYTRNRFQCSKILTALYLQSDAFQPKTLFSRSNTILYPVMKFSASKNYECYKI